MPHFELKATVAENVEELRRALGSATRELSRDDLANMIAAEHSSRAPNATSVARWEAGTEPDYESAKIMAKLAGVTFEEFTLGPKGNPAPYISQVVEGTPKRLDTKKASPKTGRGKRAG